MIRILCLLSMILGLNCTQNDLNAQQKLQVNDFEALLQKDSTIQLIDVRTPEEFNSGHLAGAQNLNLQAADFAQKINTLDKTRPVLVYCAVGGRSAKAASQFSKAGFKTVFDLKGGITAWKAAGKLVQD